MTRLGLALPRTRYLPIGQPWTQTGGAPQTDKLFTGHEVMGYNSGLYYAGARYYSADLGRFLSADPLVPNAGNPQLLNHYAYAGNNPLRFTDPAGPGAVIRRARSASTGSARMGNVTAPGKYDYR